VIAILVPVLSRPQNARPLVESIHAATTVPYEIHFLCSPGDGAEIEAVSEMTQESRAQGTVVSFANGPGDWAKKINFGFAITQSEFCLLGADDLRFHVGWDKAALKVAEDTGAGVIGTNDLGNATVMRGLHSTHPLVRRAYVETYGTIDTPGQCLHDEYSHQWVDTELVETAKVRRQWAFASDSRVEHMHPFWKKGDMDATYEKALSTSKEDHALYQQRRLLWSRAAMRAG